MRGLSELYGSWKITCMRRRSASSSLALELRDVDAVEEDLARGRLARAAGCSGRSWSCRSRSRRPGPASRRGAIVKSTPSTAFTSPTLRRAHDALGDREVHARARAPRGAASRRAALRSCRRASGGLGAAISALRKQAARWPGSPAGSSGGCASAQRVDREAAARPERAAAVEPRQIGRLALDRIEPRLARPVEPRHRAQQRHACRDGAGRGRSRRPCRSRRCGRHT